MRTHRQTSISESVKSDHTDRLASGTNLGTRQQGRGSLLARSTEGGPEAKVDLVRTIEGWIL